MPKGRASDVDVAARRARMLSMLTLRATKEMVIKQLLQEGFKDVSERTYERDMEAIKAEAMQWIDNFAKDGLVEEYQGSILSLKERVRRLILVESAATRPADKIAANLAIRQIELDLITLYVEGPTVWALKRKGERLAQAQIDKAGQRTDGT